MSTKSEKFILERKEYWEELRLIIEKIKKKGYRFLTIYEFLEYPNLYRKTCTDSETAKSLQLSPDTVDYINNLVMQSHNILYSSPKKTFFRFKNFFLYDFPKSFLKNILPISIIFFLFFGISTLVFFIIYFYPQYAKHILPSNLIEHMEKAYSNSVERNIYENIYMSGYYISNNVSIAFSSFVLGITYGLGTLYVIIYNALIIGGIAGVVVSAGHGSNFLNFVIAHSAFELIGICLAGGAGLSIGLSMIIAKDEKRGVIFNRKARELVPVIIVAALFIFFAAFIEGFISASKIHIFIKAGISIFSLIFIVLYSYRIFILKIIVKMQKLKKRTSLTQINE